MWKNCGGITKLQATWWLRKICCSSTQAKKVKREANVYIFGDIESYSLKNIATRSNKNMTAPNHPFELSDLLMVPQTGHKKWFIQNWKWFHDRILNIRELLACHKCGTMVKAHLLQALCHLHCNKILFAFLVFWMDTRKHWELELHDALHQLRGDHGMHFIQCHDASSIHNRSLPQSLLRV